MTAPPQPNTILGLASSVPAERKQAAILVLRRSRGTSHEMDSHHRFTAVLIEDWQALTDDREPIIHALAAAMVDSETDLMAVNMLAYALATAGEDGLTELLPLLSHGTFWIRAYAAEGLGALNNAGRWAVPALSRALADSRPDWTAYTMIRALGHIGGQEATALLEGLALRERARTPQDVSLLAGC